MDISDEQLISAYNELKSVRKVGEKFGMPGQSVHKRLKKYNLTNQDGWTNEEINLLRELYAKYDEKLFLNSIAKELGKTHAAVALMASRLELTRKSRPISAEAIYKGLRHPNRYKSSGFAHRAAGGFRNDLGFYVRSRWEANYARYLNFIKDKGIIIKWEYEPDTLEFHGIKRGTRFYTPDFKVYYSDGRYEYHEVKGWMNQKSKTTLKRMKKYYPDITVIVLRHDFFRDIRKRFSRLITGWEEKVENLPHCGGQVKKHYLRKCGEMALLVLL